MNLLPPFPEIPSAWLLLVQDYHGIIAGGALRDLHLGQTIKDVDIFVQLDVFDRIPMLDAGETYDCEVVNRIEQDGICFEILARKFKTHEELIAGFDIGICQVAYDELQKKWIFTDAYIHDFLHKTLTVVNRTAHWEKHLLRLMPKFPDWKIYLPPE